MSPFTITIKFHNMFTTSFFFFFFLRYSFNLWQFAPNDEFLYYQTKNFIDL